MTKRQPPARPVSEDNRRATTWLSRGFETLLEACSGAGDAAEPFDVVVVGSGYGGAVAAAELATRFARVCVLERGSEYLPGGFPSTFSELAGHVRFSGPQAHGARGNRQGLFDLRLGPDVCALVANGVGGGSLINAGVMEAPAPEVFADPAWPAGLRRDAGFVGDLAGYHDLALRLGAAVADGGQRRRNTVDRADRFGPLPKLELLQRLAPHAPMRRQTAITMGLKAGDTSAAGVALNPCIGCGDCATGCNHGAKNSLDCNLLASAVQAGAAIYTGATVLRLARGQGDTDDGWVLTVTHTDAALRARLPAPLRLRAPRVVLAAGTFGSTEILMRSRGDALRFSPKLGQRFSTNGDMISVVHDVSQRGHCAAGGPAAATGDRATTTPPARSIPDPVGPTITGMIDLRGDAATATATATATAIGRGLVIEDLAVPAALRMLFDETVTTAATLHRLAQGDATAHRPDDALRRDDPCAIDPKAIEHSLLVAMMWRDRAEGQLTLSSGDAPGSGDGALHVHWPALRDAAELDAADRRLDALCEACGLGAGRVISNPLWRLLPDKLDFLMARARGPLLTVHPLGGCPMGDDVAQGVVDDLGRVFDAAAGSPNATHSGLLVLDGAIVPTSLGINPGLTIAALAQRALVGLFAADPVWQCAPTGTPEAARRGDDRGALPRPFFRAVPPTPPAPRPTTVQVVERMCGVLRLRGYGPRFVELTLHFEPKAVRELIDVRGPRTLTIARQTAGPPSSSGRLRVFAIAKVPDFLQRRFGHHAGTPYALSDGDALAEGLLDSDADWIGDVSGTLELFRHAERSASERRWRALPAWLLNRGLRDTWQYFAEKYAPGAPPMADAPAFGQRFADALNLASRAGEVRLLEYALTIDRITPVDLDAVDVARFKGGVLRGTKRLTYDCASNPWRQLGMLSVDAFPQLDPAGPAPRLALDLHHLARQGIPLLRIVDQQDQPAALADLAAFALYLLRMLLNVHVWSFRKPDSAPLREIDRLPGAVPGLPLPLIEEIAVGERDGRPVFIRLTHYAAPERYPGQPRPNPVLMIHGYSASGTTFAHAAVRPNLAEYLHRRGRDVWIVDLRTSAGMPTANLPWTFEEAARADIPVAIDHVWRAAGGHAKLDIVAHCMGAAMLSMALLGERFTGDERLPAEPHWDKRAALHERLRCVVLSQVGPAVMFSPANVLRAFVMRYARHFIGRADFRFRTGPKPGLADQLLDRLLATLPYPEHEFRRENPLAFWRRTPWTATRHRMDALYGRDFSLANVTPAFLARIDDHFGPLSLDTVAQAIHFARFNTVTDHTGYNAFLSPRRLAANFDFRLLCIHGVDNGLADVTTLDLMKRTIADVLGPDRIETLAVEHHGHQDCLVGKEAADTVFAPIEAFFAASDR